MYFVKILVRIILEYHLFLFSKLLDRFEGRLNFENFQNFDFQASIISETRSFSGYGDIFHLAIEHWGRLLGSF